MSGDLAHSYVGMFIIGDLKITSTPDIPPSFRCTEPACSGSKIRQVIGHDLPMTMLSKAVDLPSDASLWRRTTIRRVSLYHNL
jgi:hypothetical protein